MVSPGEFIPLAEESGLIVPLGEWILKTACLQMKEWELTDTGSIRVAINLSARQFQQGNLTGLVENVVKETGINPRYLELEITEGIAMKDFDYTIKKFEHLKELGVTLSLDDFGTGYSSLSYLKSFPIDKLKIDKSFVDEMALDKVNEMMISTIITIARNLDLDVIAEGVETAEQLAFLKNENCDEVQGYYFGKPMTVEDFDAWFKSR